ncbi:hypothetical protein Lalb_Chr17g0347091 [Lupinus albus]|uniref:Uncharacterized protein n=1 Tax=Lupinus albus TaxID=3870 RepID=A0A6A4PB13_LUPAL|nr:hypothetical protein Lalb_Chr17g0347091 [Lupinus albus]
MPSFLAHPLLMKIITIFENNINVKCSSSSWEQPSQLLSLFLYSLSHPFLRFSLFNFPSYKNTLFIS